MCSLLSIVTLTDDVCIKHREATIKEFKYKCYTSCVLVVIHRARYQIETINKCLIISQNSHEL